MVDTYPLKRLPGAHKSHDTVIRTVCQECTVGCGLLAYLREGAIIDIQGDEAHPVSRGRLCAKGIAFPQGLDHPDRITQISRRSGLDSPLEAADDWEKALDAAAEQLRKIKARFGARSLMIGCDPDAGLDFYIGAMRFARLWGTPHVFHPLYSPGGMSVHRNDMNGSVPRCSDWVKSRCIFLVEADLATTHPVAFSRLLDAREQGARVIALDSRFTPTMSKADVALMIRPESGNKVGLAILKAMLEEGLIDEAAAELLFTGCEQWRASYASMPYDALEPLTGLSTEKLQEIARLLSSRKPVTVITGKRLAHRPNSSIWHTMSMAAGWSGVQGGGWYPLDAGLPPFHPYADIDEQDSRGAGSEDEERFGADIEESPDVSADPERPVKAMICSGNCLNDFMAPLRGVAGSTDLNIYFGAFPNETWALSHLVLPATLWPEKESLGFNNDRAIQWGNRVVEPAQGCRSGLELWIGLAQRLADVRRLEWKAYFPWKKEDGGADHRALYGWLLDQSPYTAGYSLDRIMADDEAGSTSYWPSHATHDAAASDRGPEGKIEPFSAPPSLGPPPRMEDAEAFPLTFQTTRVISRSGDASGYWPWTKTLEYPDEVQIHPETARALGIENGEEVVVRGPGGEIGARARITRSVPKWMIWSARRVGANRVVVHKKGQAGEQAAQILRELLR